MSDPYRIVLASPEVAYTTIDRMKPEAKGDLWSEISPAADEWALSFGSTDGLTYAVYMDDFDQASGLARKWGGLR